MVTGLSIEHSPFLVIPCEDVKPNSANDGGGQGLALVHFSAQLEPFLT